MVVSMFIRGVIGSRNDVAIGPKTQLGFHRFWTFFTIRFASKSNGYDAIEISTKKESFTVKYLVSSCGLSLESAKSVSKKVYLKSPEGPDSFLMLLKKYGFTDSQLSRIVRSHPNLLLCNAEKTLMPKLEFFSANGIVNSNLTKLISSQPIILSCSLENRIIPGYSFLKSVLVRNEFVLRAISRSWILLCDLHKVICPNISCLREVGLPQSSIVQLLKDCPYVLGLSVGKLEERIKEVIDMGFNTKEMKIVKALGALVGQSESKWHLKVEIYKRWGWSEDDILLAFKKHPICMILSEKKINSAMEFFISKMDMNPSVIAACPTLLNYSLKKRIIPRCSVIKILCSKDVLKRNIPLTTVLIMSEKHFLVNYVIKYQDRFPQLFDVFDGKVSL